jgi:hypothetical protein
MNPHGYALTYRPIDPAVTGGVKDTRTIARLPYIEGGAPNAEERDAKLARDVARLEAQGYRVERVERFVRVHHVRRRRLHDGQAEGLAEADRAAALDDEAADVRGVRRPAADGGSMRREWVIVDDNGEAPLYHVRIMMGLFNECTHKPDEAQRFDSRRRAACRLKMLRRGFRIVPAPERTK